MSAPGEADPASARLRLRARHVAILIAAYALVTFVMTWPYVSYRHFASAIYGGDARLILWTLAWDNHAVLTGTPLFDSNLFFPAPHSLQYNEHLFGVSVFTLPWAMAGASPVLAYNATWWLAWILNGLATFALLRRLVASAAAAFAGSLVFVCSFYVMLHAHGHLHLIWLWPIPLSLLLLERWFDEPRVATMIALVATLLVGILTSWYIAVMVVLAGAACLFVLVATFSGVRRADSGLLWRRRVLQALAAAIVVCACVYPFARYYIGLRAKPGEAEGLSAGLASYLVPPANTIVGRWWLAHVNSLPGPIWGEQTLFAGWIALALACAGLVELIRGNHVPRRAWVFPLMGVTGFLLSLGPAPVPGLAAAAPFHWLTFLPGFAGIRAAARFAVLFTLGLAGLAAIGAASIVRRWGQAGSIAVAALVPLMLAEWFVVGFPAGVPVPDPVPAIYRTPQVRSARSLVSLPDYWDTEQWFRGGDYLYYSIAHWRPIVNGFGRAAPPDYNEVRRIVTGFPQTADAIRRLGVQYVVLHANRFPDHGAAILAAARETPGSRLVGTIGTDYLFEIVAP